MASGVAVVGPINGGLGEVIKNLETGLLINTGDEEKCFAAACRLIADRQLRQKLRDQAFSVTRWTPLRSAARILDIVLADVSCGTSAVA